MKLFTILFIMSLISACSSNRTQTRTPTEVKNCDDTDCVVVRFNKGGN